MSESRVSLDTWDYATGSTLVFLTCCIGIYHMVQARNAKNASQFLLSNTDLGIIPLALSSIATFLSGILLTGFPAETYTDGATYMALSISLIVLAPFIIYFYMPVFYGLKTKTVYEYLEYRFNRHIRTIASILFTVMTILYTAVVIYAPSMALNQVTGLPFWKSVGIIGVLCIIYTSLGGFKAVVWTDAAQAATILVILMIIITKSCMDAGGIQEIWRICAEGQRTHLFKFKDDGKSFYTYWTMTIGGTIHFLGFLGTNQMLMQRYLSTKTLQDARRCFLLASIGNSFVAGTAALCGLIMYAKYHDCDPMLNNVVKSRDQIMALFAVETLSFAKGLPGIFVASLMCATLSTLSSCLNSLSAVAVEDYLLPNLPHMTDLMVIRYSKIIAGVYGLLCIGGVAVAQVVGGVMKGVFSAVGMIGGPILALFTIGMLCPWMNSKGAVAGAIAGFLFTGWASIGSIASNSIPPTAPFRTDGCNNNKSLFNFNSTISEIAANSSQYSQETSTYEDIFVLYTLSPLWYASWCCCAMFIVGLFVSFITGPRNPDTVDPKLIFPPVRTLISSMSKKYLHVLGFDPKGSPYLPSILSANLTELRWLRTDHSQNTGTNVDGKEEKIDLPQAQTNQDR